MNRTASRASAPLALGGMALASLLMLSSCEVGRTDSASASGSGSGTATAGGPDQAAIQQHLDTLAKQIGQLEDQLGHGKGALRNGPSFSVDGSGQESLLERLRRIQKELGEAHAEIAAKDKLIADLRGDLTTSKSHGDTLAEQADALNHVRDSLVTARQELADRQAKLAAASEQLGQSELSRLHAERTYYQLAGGLLKLAPGQTQELVDLQEMVRGAIKDLRPTLSTEAK